MKKVLIICLLGLACSFVTAQTDNERVSISAVQPAYENIPEEARGNLETKMQKLISNCGLASSTNDRFIMTARVDVNDREVNTAGMIVQYMDITLIIGDMIEEKVYGTTTVKSMGIGETETKCFIKAFQAIKPNNQTLIDFVNRVKEDIVSFYTNNCQFILQDADRMAGMQQYDEAIASLVAVPKVCADCYALCQTKAVDIYNVKIENEGRQLIQDARSAWLVKRDYDCAAKALDILARVNPNAQCQKDANALIDEINSHLRKTEAAEAAAARERWLFKVKQYEDKMELERQKQADRAAILGTLAGNVGKINIGIKHEKAYKLGSSSK